MKRTAVTVLAVTMVTLAGCGGSDKTDAAAASASAAQKSQEAAADARRVAANSAAAASSSAEAAAAASSAAAASAAAEAARKVPTQFSGTGDSVVAITKPPGVTVAVATITGNKAGRLFAVKEIDGEQDLLVNTTDPYTGSVLMDADSGGTTQLEVKAVGPWTITISDVLTAPALNKGANTGTGDAVLVYYEQTRAVAAITGNAAGRLFAVLYYSSSGRDLLVNTTDQYTGTVPMAAGPGFVEVKAVDDWSITVQ